MSVFQIPESYGPYIDTHVPAVLDKYNADANTVATEIDQWDENVSSSINSAHAYATSFFQELMDKVNEGVSQLRADIAEVKRLKQKRWQDASNSFNWAGSSGPGIGLDSITNAVEGIWNNDKARRDHANAAVREGGYDAEIARLEGIKSHLDGTVRSKVQSAIDKANEVLDKANDMAPQVLRLAELNSSFVWVAFRLGAYKQSLTEFRDTAGATDLSSALDLDRIQSDLMGIKVKIVDGQIVLTDINDPAGMTMPQAAAQLHQDSLTVFDLEGNANITEESLIPDRGNVGATLPPVNPVVNQTHPQYHPNSEGLVEYSYEGVDGEIFTEYKEYVTNHPEGLEDFGTYMMARYESGSLSEDLSASIESYLTISDEVDVSDYFNVWKMLLSVEA